MTVEQLIKTLQKEDPGKVVVVCGGACYPSVPLLRKDMTINRYWNENGDLVENRSQVLVIDQ